MPTISEKIVFQLPTGASILQRGYNPQALPWRPPDIILVNFKDCKRSSKHEINILKKYIFNHSDERSVRLIIEKECFEQIAISRFLYHLFNQTMRLDYRAPTVNYCQV